MGKGGRVESRISRGGGSSSLKAGAGAAKGAARQGEGGGSTAGGGSRRAKRRGWNLSPALPSAVMMEVARRTGRRGAPRKAARTCAKRGNACQGGRARGEVCGMAPRLARGSKRRAWTLIPQRRQYQLNHLRHRAEKRGLSGGDGRRGACEWSCEATVHAWRVSSAVWSAPCRRGV